jgi:hypothetical protein
MKTESGYDVDFTKVIDHGITTVQDAHRLNDGIMGNPEWVKVGNIKEKDD